jgi:hypothetical protein
LHQQCLDVPSDLPASVVDGVEKARQGPRPGAMAQWSVVCMQPLVVDATEDDVKPA